MLESIIQKEWLISVVTKFKHELSFKVFSTANHMEEFILF